MRSSVPDASPTRTSATYIAGNRLLWRESASAKLSPERTPDRILATVDRKRPMSISVASSSSASSSLAPAFSRSARSRVKIVTASERARCPNFKLNSDVLGARSSTTVSMGTSRRYSIRRATSAEVGADINPLTTSPLWVNARYRKFGMASPHGGDAEDLGGGCHPSAALGDGILEHRGHSRVRSSARDRCGVGPRADQPTQVVAYLEDLENPGTPAVTGPAATFASTRLMHQVIHLQAEHCVARIRPKSCCRQPSFDLAAFALYTNEPLRDHRAQCRLEQETLDAEVDEPRHGCRGRLGVQGGEHQMASERGMYGDVGGFGIADLSDHDHIRILANEGTQSGGKGEPDLRLHL